jgi:hypothetical protein
VLSPPISAVVRGADVSSQLILFQSPLTFSSNLYMLVE